MVFKPFVLAAGPIALLLAAPLPLRSQEPDSGRSDERARMVREQIIERGIEDQAVLGAMLTVPRHLFVPETHRDRAYGDHPLPIGHGQTISQPYIVAFMTELLELEPADQVLEVGTGSGYQAAVAAMLADSVFSVEIVPELAASAEARLDRLGYRDVQVGNADGYYGWEEHAPYDAIFVTAAAGHVPPPLVQQLAPGGRMAIPVGGPFQLQNLVLVEKAADGTVTTRSVLPVQFVPLTGEH
ncbi:MAG TPA: protein-L-isoaspartate(D-aspartate) O-methyltransferase [Gemmatimonadota bacterium]|nr:protein-L-isoaspartate(D-aspartate) O-methyltransferase [Gemmatimonadota bacterium]